MLSFSVFVSIHRRSSHFRLLQAYRPTPNLYATPPTGPRVLVGTLLCPIIIPLSPSESALTALAITAHSKGFSAGLKSFRMRTYAKTQGGGAVMVNQVTVTHSGLPSSAVGTDDILYILRNRWVRQGVPNFRVNYV